MKPILIFLFLLSLTSISKGSKEEPPSLYFLLISAIQRGDSEVVTNLIKEGASVYGSYTIRPSAILPLEFAINSYIRTGQRATSSSASRYEIVNILIKHGGAHLNNLPWTILHRLASEHNIQGIAILLSLDADVNARDIFGNTPLHRIASPYKILKLPLKDNVTKRFFEYNKQTAQFLIDKGADINAKNDSGDTPLHLIIKNTVFLDQEPPFFYRAFARHLVRTPEPVSSNEKRSAQLTTLLNTMTLAVLDSSFTNLYIHYLSSIRLWIENGADVYAENNDGLTPLDLMAQKEYSQYYTTFTHTLLETKPKDTSIKYYDIVYPYDLRTNEDSNDKACKDSLS